ncbi:protein GL2-INTERACTING REPRESSOR 2-like [Curcuma longa]|uniref:protein GL2-INTERACTING REPRESSOR 2-like n=1 Tax=Curcuma longa TaxID=136217 RepID=UPI003D9EC44C
MSRNRKGQKLDLKLNLALIPSRVADEASPHGCLSSSPSASSCLSAEPDLGLLSSMSPEATSSMVLAGCPRCLMYVMLSEDDKKCPKCASTVLLDFFHASAGGSKHVNKKTRMS